MEGLRNPAQQARRPTEAWFEANMYCAVCPADRLTHAPRNARVFDFVCDSCGAKYEVKAQSRCLGQRVADAAYSAMAEMLRRNMMPHFAFLHYDRRELAAVDLLLVPSHFITTPVIERRPPLAGTARRAGWVGCDILLREVPPDGRIVVIQRGVVAAPRIVRASWQRFGWLGHRRVEARGWTADVLRCLRKIGLDQFTLADVYCEWEPELADRHPDNRNVRAKIRQQLQILRDRGIVRFLGRGRYQATEEPG